MQSYAVSIQGRRARNEDATLCLHDCVADEEASLIAVADGMGGQKGGQKASELAICTLEEAWREFAEASEPVHDRSVRQFLHMAYAQANRRIAEHVDNHPEMNGMGTTLVAVVVIGQRAWVANVGDSRAYLLLEDDLEQITNDHSALADSVRAGIMTEAEARQSPYRGALTRAVDGLDELEVDIFPPQHPELPLPENCLLVVCSDGLSGAVTELELFEAFRHTTSVQAGCEASVGYAYQAGSNDNVSVVALEIGRVPRLDESVAVPAVPDAARSAEEQSAPPTLKARPSRPQRTQIVLLGALGILLAGLIVAFVAQIQLQPPGSLSVDRVMQFMAADSAGASSASSNPVDSLSAKDSAAVQGDTTRSPAPGQ